MSGIARRTFVRTTVGTTLAAATLAADDYRIFDPHVHVWKHDPEFPFAQGQNVPERDATPETLLGLMKSNGGFQDRPHSGDSLPLRQPFSGAHAEAVSEDVQGRVPGGSTS